MDNFKLLIEYDGTNYIGWQKQKETFCRKRNLKVRQKSIQATLEQAVYKITGEKVSIFGSGRTDAGVHASGQVANFKTNCKINIDEFFRSVNGVLPEDIFIKKIKRVNPDFHARFSAKRKKYRYCIINSKYCSPFKKRFYTHVPYFLDFDLMKDEIVCLKGRHDFKAFQSADKKEKNSIREVYNVKLKKYGKVIIFDIEANGFLYKMVRNIAGTLIDIGRGRLPKESMEKILDCKNRSKCGSTAEGKGLFLIKVYY